MNGYPFISIKIVDYPQSTSVLLGLPGSGSGPKPVLPTPGQPLFTMDIDITIFLGLVAVILQTDLGAVPTTFGSNFGRLWETPGDRDPCSIISIEKNRDPKNSPSNFCNGQRGG
jgi:hypothetical protein